MAQIKNTAFEVRVSNGPFNMLENITGIFHNTSQETEICSAGFLVKRTTQVPNEGYTGINNDNTWYMEAAAAADLVTTPIFACNPYQVNQIQDGANDNVFKVGANTLGLALPKGEFGTFTHIVFDGMHIYRFGIGNLSQLNSIAGNLNAAFGVPEAVTGAVLAAVSAVILLGGLKRVAAVAERLVPAMALLYIVGALTVVGVHITAVPAALAAIVKGAFGLRAAGGGIVGYGLSRAVTWGFKRGAFSNEAGLGSSVMVHAASNVKEPVQQGMWGIFEVFADTMVVCTLTALVVLTSGFVDLDTGRIAAGAAGSALVGLAFDAVFGTLGSKLIAVCILLFAYSTTLGWSCYGCKAVEYLFGAGAGAGYRVLFVALMPMGAVMRLDLAWTLSDTFNGLMMLPNLIGVIALSGTVVRITQNYLARKLHGSPAPPLLSAGETI